MWVFSPVVVFSGPTFVLIAESSEIGEFLRKRQVVSNFRVVYPYSGWKVHVY